MMIARQLFPALIALIAATASWGQENAGPGPYPLSEPLPAPAPPASNPGLPPLPGPEEGAMTVGQEQTRAYAIENPVPLRVPVRPDDPESAWWEVDPRVAFAKAQREQRPLLLLFTADWNPKCLKLSEEVFSSKSFNEFVKKHAVICYLNFPSNSSDAPDLFRQWKDRFGVMGYPNLLVFDPDGRVTREIRGYTVGKPVTYFGEISEIVLPLSAAIEEKKTALRAKGFRDWKNGEGVTLFAQFVRHGGGLVTLRGVNGEEWTVENAKLSAEDQALVASFPSTAEIGGTVNWPTP